MNVSNRCWKVLINESAQNDVFIDANSKPITYKTLNLDSIEDRIQYLFKYSPYHVLLSKTSIINFASNVPEAIEIINSLFCSKKNLSICSLSSGLGEDLIGFLCAVKELNIFPKGSFSIGLINKYESCCQTAKNLFDAYNFNLSYSLEYIQCDPLTSWTEEAANYLSQTDAVFLAFPFVKYINKSRIFLKFMKDLFKNMKSGAYLFCFFQTKQDEYFRSKEFDGFILNNQLEVEVCNVPYNEQIIEIIGLKPILSGVCYLTVWKKKDPRIPVSPNILQSDIITGEDQHNTLSIGFQANKNSVSESNQTVLIPESLQSITSSETLLTSLTEKLKHSERVLKKCKTSGSSNLLLETESSEMEMDSLVNALLLLEESLKRLRYILRKNHISCSTNSEHSTTEAEKDINILIKNEIPSVTEDSNESLSSLIKCLNNLIDKLEG